MNPNRLVVDRLRSSSSLEHFAMGSTGEGGRHGGQEPFSGKPTPGASVHELREESLTEARRRRENGNRLSRPECRDNRSYLLAVTWISCLVLVSISVLRIGHFFPAVVAESPTAVSPASFFAPCSPCLCESSSLKGVNGYAVFVPGANRADAGQRDV